MKTKWETRVYIDLFSGAGRAKIIETSNIVKSSPLISLSINDPFDYYIFCEQNSELISALHDRVNRDYSCAKVSFIEGNSNVIVEKILESLPAFNKERKMLTFCFVDPFKLDNMKFATIMQLAERFMDFLILLPTGMDATRNMESTYVDSKSIILDEYFGTAEWRENYEHYKRQGKSIALFLTDFFAEQMQRNGYIYKGADKTVLIRSKEKNLPLYRLILFSRHELGYQFWQETKKYSDSQLDLAF